MKGLIVFFSMLLIVACHNQSSVNSSSEENSTLVTETSSGDGNTPESPVIVVDDSQSPMNLKTLAGLGQCAVDSDCALIGLGARACGGPDEYLVYSKHHPELKEFMRQVEDYNQQQQALNEKEQRRGICVVAPKPLYSCSQQKCQLDLIAGSSLN